MESNIEIKFALIICTYHRADSLKRLLESVVDQSLYPDQILIIDGSKDYRTHNLLRKNSFANTEYLRVKDKDRGLTRQRNFGISKVREDIEVVCFLDDDIVLKKEYFEQLIRTYKIYPNALAVGGKILDETEWRRVAPDYKIKFDEFKLDGFVRKLGSRNVLRKRLGLLPNQPPGFMPEFSHGFSTGFLPPSDKIYSVEFFMGGVSSYRKELFSKIAFSTYFEGYGLYEDMDFCLRASKIGQLYLNTAACCYHFHEEAGRPDQMKYGKMVVRNGHYVWKLKNPNPGLDNIIKWNLITFLLLVIRFKNDILDGEKEARKDAIGRLKYWILLAWNPTEPDKPKS